MKIIIIVALFLFSCTKYYGTIVFVGNDRWRTDDGLCGGRVKTVPIGHRLCEPYRTDQNDQRVYIECPAGNLVVYDDLENYFNNSKK